MDTDTHHIEGLNRYCLQTFDEQAEDGSTAMIGHIVWVIFREDPGMTVDFIETETNTLGM